MNNISWTKAIRIPTRNRCVIVRPEVSLHSLPVLYLLHGISDVETDWMSDQKGQLPSILLQAKLRPMLIVIPYVGLDGNREPDLQDVWKRFLEIRAYIFSSFSPDVERQGILGISMGAKQALSIVLKDKKWSGFSALGLLSGMFQGDHLRVVKNHASAWPSTLGEELALYFHYCGQGNDIVREQGPRSRGDNQFYESNNRVCQDLNGRNVRTREDGLHNWQFWRPELAEFFGALNKIW